MRVSAVLFTLLVGSFTVHSAEAQGAADSAVIMRPSSLREATDLGLKLIGVFDDQTGEWLDRVVVRDTLGHETATSRIGVATLNALEPVAGVFLLELRKPGYQPARLRLRADTSAQVMVALHPNPLSATTLAPVVTKAHARIQADSGLANGFFGRCQLGAACVGPDEIERRPTQRLADLLGVIPGLHRDCVGVSCTVLMDGFGRKCTPYYFVNGFRWTPSGGTGTPQSQIEKAVDFSRVTGIEVYLTMQDKPPRFDVTEWASCGSIVIWLR